MAKRHGVSNWHSMRKEQLVRALTRLRQRQARKPKPVAAPKSARPAARSGRNGSAAKTARQRRNGSARKTARQGGNGSAAKSARKPALARRVLPTSATVARRPRLTVRKKTPEVLRRIEEAHANRERLKDLSTDRLPRAAVSVVTTSASAGIKVNGNARRDRLVLMVRDSYWLHACWEVRRQSVERVRMAMAEAWHTARPVLRLVEVENGVTTNTAERVLREIPIHGGVSNWYIDVQNPPSSFRVVIGYLSSTGKFYALSRSNSVTTPRVGAADGLDQNWSEVARDCERIYAMSGGYADESSVGDLKELFEERLRRPMGASSETRFGAGAEGIVLRPNDFSFQVDSELVIYGRTRPEARVTIAGQPIKLRPDGTFSVRQNLPDRRQVLPLVAASRDGLEQRTVILAIERNTKIMEPVTREFSE
jgi:uncharacterized protein